MSSSTIKASFSLSNASFCYMINSAYSSLILSELFESFSIAYSMLGVYSWLGAYSWLVVCSWLYICEVVDCDCSLYSDFLAFGLLRLDYWMFKFLKLETASIKGFWRLFSDLDISMLLMLDSMASSTITLLLPEPPTLEESFLRLS